jgi:Ca2+-binding RTX toxin-like protein
MTEYAPFGSEFDVNSTYARTQANAETTQLADGRFIVVWREFTVGTSANQFLKAQIFNPDGTPSGSELTLANSGLNPVVTAQPGGGFLLVWETFSAVRAQSFNANGTPAGAAFDVSPISAQATLADVASLPGGGFAIVWQDTRTSGGDTSGSGIHIRAYNSLSVAYSDIQLNQTTLGNQADASIAALPSGGYVATWTDRSSTIYGRFVGADGVPTGAQFTISTAQGSAVGVESSVTVLANGNVAVAWYGWSNELDQTAHQIQVINSAGQASGPRITVPHGFYGGSATGPEIVALADGGFALAWTANTSPLSDGSGRAIFVQAFNADGSVAMGPTLANTQATGDQFDPSLVALANGSFAVIWTDTNGPSGDDDQVKAQIFAPTGTVVISSNGGGDQAAVSADENQTTVTQVIAGTGSVSWPITYSIVGGADAGLFAVNSATGALTFIQARDFENPGGNGSGTYEVIVRASNGYSSDDQTISVALADVNERPVITSDGGGTSAALTVAENGTSVTTVVASDVDGDAVQYSISGGNDAALFTIDPNTGVLNFVNAPDYEAPADYAADNFYQVTVTASDGTLSSNQTIEILVTNANEGVTVTSNGGGNTASVTVSEGQSAVTTVAATDLDGDTLTYSIVGGSDASQFSIDPSTGALQFTGTPNFESPTDADGDNIYDVVVQSSDGSLTDTQALAVTVANVNEVPTITSNGGGSSASVSVSEGSTSVTTVAASDPDGTAATFSIAGGADAVIFTIDASTGALQFTGAPNFEAPADSNGDNVYEVIVSASDGSLTDTQTLSVTVSNVNETPTITSNGGGNSGALSVSEGSTSVTTVAASDPDGATATFSIAGGADASLFAINQTTGVLTFVDAPNFETPTDANGNNIYEVTVSASDGSLVDTQALSIAVSNVNEAPVITTNGGGATANLTIAENSTAVTTVAASDPDGGSTLYAIAGGADASRFTINQSTGVLTFVTDPNFEVPTDANGNNVYEVTVSASDGSLTDTQALSITVSNVNEAPVITSNGAGNSAALTVNENMTAVTTVTSTDPEGGARTYSISGGADAARFEINATTGVLSFVTAANYEAPTDAGANNVYDVIVTASDGSLTDTQALAITIGNVVDGVTLTGTNGGNTLTGTSAEDTLLGLGGNDLLNGAVGADVLDGGKGNDTLTGGLGADQLTGGEGADTFTFTTINDTLPSLFDVITDFSRANKDKISVAGIDANANVSGDQAFAFIGTGSFTGVAGQLRYEQMGGHTFVMGDVNGDGVSDFVIKVNGLTGFVTGDFIL